MSGTSSEDRGHMGSRFEVEFQRSDLCGDDITSVRFSRPEGFDFVAGQWMMVRLGDDVDPHTETFTISSAPADDYLEITTRLSGSQYKRALSALAPGDRLEVTGPGGRLSLPAGIGRVAFLVGGVGITPVRSMMRDAWLSGRVFDDALLVYGNRDHRCVPFEAEFLEMAAIGLRTVVCLETPPPGWAGERGRINADIIRRHLDPLADDRPFIAAGPPVMVGAIERVLDDLAIADSRRMIEHFGVRAR